MKDGRYQIGEVVICRILDTDDGVPQYFAAHVVPYHFGEVKDAGYLVQLHNNSNTFREVTFYDITSYNKFKLQDLAWESQTAQRALRHLQEMWKWGEKTDEIKSS